MAIQVKLLYITGIASGGRRYEDLANEWLRINSSKIIDIRTDADGDAKLIVIYDDSDPIPQLLTTRRIRS